MDATALLHQFGKIMQKNSPSILTGLGVAGLITTVVMAVYATPKALRKVEEEEQHRWENSEIPDGDDIVPFTPTEIIQITWKEYIPAAIMGTATIACIIGSNSVNIRRNSALAALFSLTETAAREYREKVKEVIGEKKEQEVRDEIAQDAVDKHPLKDQTVIITGGGTILCFDKFSGRYFNSDVNKLNKIEIDFNRRLMRDMWLSLNDLYGDIGLESIKLGDALGWVVEIPLEFKFSSRLTPDGLPCLVLDFGQGIRNI